MYLPKERAKKQSHRLDRAACYLTNPIDQALAPYLAAGCRAVYGLVPRALFIGCVYYIVKAVKNQVKPYALCKKALSCTGKSICPANNTI